MQILGQLPEGPAPASNDLRHLVVGGRSPEDGGMNLGLLRSAAALIAVTCECAEVVRRREGRRRAEADRLASEAAGLRGLVRVFLSGSQTDNAGTNPAQ